MSTKHNTEMRESLINSLNLLTEKLSASDLIEMSDGDFCLLCLTHISRNQNRFLSGTEKLCNDIREGLY